MRIWWVVFAIGCSSAPPPTHELPKSEALSMPAPADAAVTPVVTDAGAAAVADTAQDGGAAPADVIAAPINNPAIVMGPPPIKGKVTKIAEQETKTVGGVKITFEGAGHKTAVRGPNMGFWEFKLVHGNATKDLRLASTQENFEAEVVEHGVFFVFRQTGYTTFDVVHVAGKTPKALSEDECNESIEKAAAAAKLPPGRSSSSSTDMGIVHHFEGGWAGHCGTLSRRVWFTARPTDE